MSLKSHKKSRNKNRSTPYTRRTLPTPSSPSEVEYEPILKDSPIFSEKELGFANPTELSVRDETPRRESTGFSVNDAILLRESTVFSTSDVIVPHRESTGFSSSEILPHRESTGFSMNEELVPTEVTEKEDTQTRENIECFPESEVLDCVAPMELTPREEEVEEAHEERPLRYGDLVVVDYAEKKKVYKWPAIVFPFTC